MNEEPLAPCRPLSAVTCQGPPRRWHLPDRLSRASLSRSAPVWRRAHPEAGNHHLAKDTVIPYLFEAAQKKCAIAFQQDLALRWLLRDDPERYIARLTVHKRPRICQGWDEAHHPSTPVPAPAHHARASAVVHRRHPGVTSPWRAALGVGRAGQAAPAALCAYPAVALWHAVDGVHVDTSARVLR